MTDYSNDPNYELEEEGVYRDLTTNEVVFVLDEETGESLAKILERDTDRENEDTLTSDEFNKLFKLGDNDKVS
jgi:hypothetical protein